MADFGFPDFNPNILFGIKGPQLPDPYELTQRRLTISQLQDAQLMRQLVMANQARQFASQDAYAHAVPGLEAANYSPEAVNAALQQFPAGAGDILKQVEAARQSQATAAKTAAETGKQRADAVTTLAKPVANMAFQLSNKPDLSPSDIAQWNNIVATNGLDKYLPSPRFQDWTNPDAARKTLATAGSALFEANQQMERQQAQQKLNVEVPQIQAQTAKTQAEIPGVQATTAKTQVETGLLPMEAQAKVTAANAAASNAARGWAEYKTPLGKNVQDIFGNQGVFTATPGGGTFAPAQTASGQPLQPDASIIDKVAKPIAQYDAPPLTGMAMSHPLGFAVMGRIPEINPNWSAPNYQTAQRTLNAFSAGKQGDQTRFIGTALDHLDTLTQAFDAQNNGQIPVANQLMNQLAKQLGVAAPTTFDGVKQIVGNEVVKGIVGMGGGVGDREKAQESIRGASSPEQLYGLVKDYKQLFVGQVSGLEQQYRAGTQRNDFRDRFLQPNARALIDAQRPRDALGAVPATLPDTGAPTAGGGGPRTFQASSLPDPSTTPVGAQATAQDGSNVTYVNDGTNWVRKQ